MGGKSPEVVAKGPVVGRSLDAGEGHHAALEGRQVLQPLVKIFDLVVGRGKVRVAQVG